MKSLTIEKVDETPLSPSSLSVAAAAVSSRAGGTPKGLPTLLNKMVRAVLISKPLQEVQFFADYLDAELNRRTLCQLQDLGMTVCDLEILESDKIQSLSNRVIRAARKEQFHDEQSAKQNVRNPESKCIAVQTDRNHLRYVTKSPFLQKMEAELISSVVENLNQDHECRCTCPPPPLFWYQITRPQVLRKCRMSSAAAAGPGRKKFLKSEVKLERNAVEGDDNDVELIDKKTAFSLDDKILKLRAANDAGLAKIIDREMRLKEPAHPPPPSPPPRPKTPPPVERPLKVDASSQVETLVIQPKPRLQKQETTLAREVEHKYVQTMDEEDIFRPEETAIPDQSDLPSDPIPPELDEPATVPSPDDITPADEFADLVDWSPFCEPPLQRRSSTDWLNIQLTDLSEKDYDTDWSEMTRAVPVEPEEPIIDWLSIDLRPQPEPHKCGRVSPPPPPPPPPPSAQEVIVDDIAVQPQEDTPDVDGPQTLPCRPESPARMMTPDAVDVLTGCEDPSLLLGPDYANPLVVLQWTPIVIEPETDDAQSLDIPAVVCQCSDPFDELMVDGYIPPSGQDLDALTVVLQESISQSPQISHTEVVVQMTHPDGAPPGTAMQISSKDVLMTQVSDDNEASPKSETMQQVSVSPNDELVKQVSDSNMISSSDQKLEHEVVKQTSDQNEASSKDELLMQISDDNVVSRKEEIVKLESDQNEVSPKDEMVKPVSDDNIVSGKDEVVKQASDQNEKLSKDELMKEVFDQNEVSPEDHTVRQTPDQKLVLPEDEVIKQTSDMTVHNKLSSKDEMLKQLSGHNEESLKGEMLKQVTDYNAVSRKEEIVTQASDLNDKSPENELVKQSFHQNEVLPADKMVKPDSEQNEVLEENEMLKQVFGEEVLSNSSMYKIETTKEEMTPAQTEFVTTNELQSSMHGPVLSETSSVKEKMSRSDKELNNIDPAKGGEATTGPEEGLLFGDKTNSEQKETTELGNAELVGSGYRIPMDKDEKDYQNEEDGGKEEDRKEDVEKPASNKEHEIEKGRLEQDQ